MFKLVSLFVLLGVVAARPGILSAQTSLSTVGRIVSNSPTATAITHQSQTQLQPIVSQIISPLISRITLPSIIQKSRPIISTQLLASQIPLLQAQRQDLALQNEIVGAQAPLVTETASANGDQNSLVQGGLIQKGATLIGGSQLLAQNIGIQGLQLSSVQK